MTPAVSRIFIISVMNIRKAIFLGNAVIKACQDIGNISSVFIYDLLR